MRIDKLLSNMGYGTRSEIKRVIMGKKVRVNGDIIKSPKLHVDENNDEIYIGNEKVNYREFIYIMMNKPKDVISATFDNMHETVIDLLTIDEQIFDPAPVGRLDIDTEGLLLITNDGKLSHKLLAPKKHVDKTYYAIIDSKVEEKHIKDFKEGIILDDGYKCMSADLKILESDENSKIELTIREGKFHQVKRMFKSLEMTVLYLKRVSMGSLKLDENLSLGEFRELTKDELESLKG
ncbi:MAG: rRNA pseudouridine synthase [Peptostreptococcaceae bacterium]|nr:rRNA pseudouridine synthase [Peptostreptococcaceae bacterium]